MFLLADADVEIGAELHSKGIEIGVRVFDGGRAFSLEAADLEGVDLVGIAKQIPAGGAGVCVERGNLQEGCGNGFEAEPGDDVQGGTRGASTGQIQAGQQFLGGGVKSGRAEKEFRQDVDGLAVFVGLLEEFGS